MLSTLRTTYLRVCCAVALSLAGSMSAQAAGSPTLTLTTIASVNAAVAAGTPSSGSYSSSFDLEESPLSEGGVWRRTVNNFTNVKSSGGVAYGTNGITNEYDDSYALLSGFASDQTVEAVVQRSSSLNTNVTHEAELLLRFSDSTSGARGYECLFAFYGAVQVVRWNGTQGDYTVLSSTAGNGSIGRELRTGDVIKASISGNVISLYVNGTLVMRATDSAYTTGQPGIGFFTRPGGNSAHLALTQITATSEGAASPAPVVTLSASPTSVAAGGTTALTWSATDATSCAASGAWSGTRPTAGSENSAALSISPSSFTLTCTGSSGQASRTVNITVASPPSVPVVTLSASPTSVASGGTTALTWSSTNATSCAASGTWSGTRPTAGSENSAALFTSPSSFTLTCAGPGGQASRTVNVTVVAGTPSSGSYSSNFDLAENPLSEGGVWRRAVNNFTNVKSSGGVAYGTNGITNGYDDSYALLSGLAPDQTVEAVVQRSSSLNTNVTHNAELLLRFSDSTSGARGYECQFAFYGQVQVKRWNGTQGNHTYLSSTAGLGGLGRDLRTGDVIKATISGNVINVYINGTLMARVTDSVHATGQPGIGFFIRAGGNSAHLALTQVTATSQGTASPPPGAPVVTLSASPTSVAAGGTTALTWSATNATSCVASSAWSGTRPTAGSENSAPLSSNPSSFTLTCTGPGGQASRTFNVAVAAAAPPSSGSYSSNFDLEENPLSEGGVWRRAVNNFTSVKSSGGVAYGTNGVTNTYDDSYALLSGFGPNQTVEAVVQRSSSLNTNVTHEAELLLRFSDSTSGARGYECLFAFYGGVQVVRWNGTQGDYTVLSSTAGTGGLGRELLTGDVIKASISGSVINLYINATLVMRATDSAFTTGQPGIGFFTRPGGNSAHLALTKITASSQ